MKQRNSGWLYAAKKSFALLCAGLLLSGLPTQAQAASSKCCDYQETLGEVDFCGSSQCAECLPGVGYMIRKDTRMNAIYTNLWPEVSTLENLVECVQCITDGSTQCTTGNCWETLYTWAQTYVSNNPGSRVVIALADGSLVVDTEGSNNTCSDWANRTVGPNANTYLPILQAQLSPCGLGAYKTYVCPANSSTACNSFYSACVAIRLGCYLHSVGTVMVCDGLLQ